MYEFSGDYGRGTLTVSPNVEASEGMPITVGERIEGEGDMVNSPTTVTGVPAVMADSTIWTACRELLPNTVDA